MTRKNGEKLLNFSKIFDAKLDDDEVETVKAKYGSYITVAAEVKNADRDIEINSINTLFGRDSISEVHEELIYTSKDITPEQSSLLEQPNSAQYPTVQELSTDKDTTNISENQTIEDKSVSSMISLPQDVNAQIESQISWKPKPKREINYNNFYNETGATFVEVAADKDKAKYDFYRYYICGLKIGAEDYTAKIVVGVKGDSKYHDHRLTQIEKGNLIDNLNNLSNAVVENQDSPVPKGEDSKLFEVLQINSSKIALDKDGSRHYDHDLSSIEKGKLIDSIGSVPTELAKDQLTSLGVKDTRYIEILQINSSKIALDKDGSRYYYHSLTAVEKGNLIEIANGFTPSGGRTLPSYAENKDTRIIPLSQTISPKLLQIRMVELLSTLHSRQTKSSLLTM